MRIARKRFSCFGSDLEGLSKIKPLCVTRGRANECALAKGTLTWHAPRGGGTANEPFSFEYSPRPIKATTKQKETLMRLRVNPNRRASQAYTQRVPCIHLAAEAGKGDTTSSLLEYNRPSDRRGSDKLMSEPQYAFDMYRFLKPCNSPYFTQLAAFFIAMRAK